MPGVAGHRNDQALAVPLRAISQSHLPFRQMNFIKTTIATAAVLTCCLGNSYPAHAGLTDRIATTLCRESHSSLRSAQRNSALMKSVVRRHTEKAMGTYSDPLSVIRELGEYKDAEALGWAMYRSMKRQCSTKATSLFGNL